MAKKKIELKSLGRQHIKDALLRVHPFLREKYRALKKDEIQSEEVYKELFPNDSRILWFKLEAVYEFQR